MTNKQKAMHRANIVENYFFIDLEKDFFSLNNCDYAILEKFRKTCNFSGRNNLGRSPLRQFYYHLQYGKKFLPF